MQPGIAEIRHRMHRSLFVPITPLKQHHPHQKTPYCRMSESHQILDAPSKSSWKAYLQEEVTAVWGDAVLIVGCFATGLLDSAVFNVWSCFVSMQTGESIHGYLWVLMAIMIIR
jgi:hypothetical protein